MMVQFAFADNMQAFMECKDEFKVTKEEIIADGSSQELKCFGECLLKKTGCMDEAGNFDENKIREEGNKFAKSDQQKEKFEATMRTCLEEAKPATGKCEKGFAFAKCMRAQMKREIQAQ
ncbi:PhBP [Nesidiocoris tenuis]|uniref:PhBP n=1 Tax=Nesidiocoris tenuis TaxID=355587 RepID=A0ABN7ALZ8_9HEMI|nr:PhBP [Nesidiocoris tenuis]